MSDPHTDQSPSAPDAPSPSGRIDDAAALALVAEGGRSVEQIAAALRCTILDLAAWQARPDIARKIRSVESLYIDNAHLLLARLKESLVIHAAAIATGAVEGESIETQRKACMDLLKLNLRAVERVRYSGGRPHGPPVGSARNESNFVSQDLANDGDCENRDDGPRISEEAILDALQKLGEESRQRTIADRIAYNAHAAAHPELGWLQVPVPEEHESVGRGVAARGPPSA